MQKRDDIETELLTVLAVINLLGGDANITNRDKLTGIYLALEWVLNAETGIGLVEHSVKTLKQTIF